MKCKIVSVGKRRDGGTRYWCLKHRADATAKYGVEAEQCRHAHIEPPKSNETFDLKLSEFEGGVALWGAVPPIYDTTNMPLERGVHVHGRLAAGRRKEVDETYRLVRIGGADTDLLGGKVEVSELDAIYYMVSSVFNFRTKYVECTYCGYPHLDKDWFSVHSHQRHLCAGCGKKFGDVERAIGNPLANLQEQLTGKKHKTKKSSQSIDLRQADYFDGIRIWGSNPAILWTSSQAEESGIHVHAFGDTLIDDTFANVSIDGVSLDPAMTRVLMAQNTLPHIEGRVISANCPKCNTPHFDSRENAFTPHDVHSCDKCGNNFRVPGRVKKVICNPMCAILSRLEVNAPRPPRKHDIGLLVESI